MELKSKLRQFLPKETPKKAPPQRTVPDLRPILGGEEVETPWGPCHVVEQDFPLDHSWGNLQLGEAASVVYPEGLARVGLDELPHFDLARTLFLDTETTGLAGGTGTYAFLVGTGRFVDGRFVVKQFLMRDYNEEVALLYCLEQELRNSQTIVSFNGKTFDIPLLRTRFAMTRMSFLGVEQHSQIDLLHLARRLWRSKLASCSLTSLEENVLGFTRSGDIPGFEIPQRYFLFLQSGNGLLLRDILEHNAYDIISMAVLMGVINARGMYTPADCTCPWEAEALGGIYAGAGRITSALAFLERALSLAQDKEQQVRLLRTAALLHKRHKHYAAAAELWHKLLSLAEDDLMAHEELAKHYEHREKDFAAADQMTRRALAIALRQRSPKVPELEHRLRRITNRRQRVG
ncbi:MAG: ribonuclease H-like domain-containing protein [Limnochordia bacterium]